MVCVIFVLCNIELTVVVLVVVFRFRFERIDSEAFLGDIFLILFGDEFFFFY